MHVETEMSVKKTLKFWMYRSAHIEIHTLVH